MKVVYLGCTDSQACFGGSCDPRPYLVVGQEYELAKKEIHSWHTRYWLEGFNLTPFNSVCFTQVSSE